MPNLETPVVEEEEEELEDATEVYGNHTPDFTVVQQDSTTEEFPPCDKCEFFMKSYIALNNLLNLLSQILLELVVKRITKY